MDIKVFWDAVLRQDADTIREYFHPDAWVNWHNTNEHFTVEEFIQANCEYPGEWDGEVEQIIPLIPISLLPPMCSARTEVSPAMLHPSFVCWMERLHLSMNTGAMMALLPNGDRTSILEQRSRSSLCT